MRYELEVLLFKQLLTVMVIFMKKINLSRKLNTHFLVEHQFLKGYLRVEKATSTTINFVMTQP